MPIYEFRCEACGELFDDLVAAGTESVPCPACGAEPTRRVLSAQAAPMAIVRPPGSVRKQERRNAQLRDRARASFKARRERARDDAKRSGRGR